MHIPLTFPGLERLPLRSPFEGTSIARNKAACSLLSLSGSLKLEKEDVFLLYIGL